MDNTLALLLARRGGSGGSGGGGASVAEKDVNFYDYDGTVLYAYTVEEAQALNEMPALPEHEGLICQGWNYDLETINAYTRAVNVGAIYITDDGKTRIYISLHEGRTSPMLGVCPNGTVTVDWGDGTEPDVLTGTSTSKSGVQWTPNHEYASAGDYVISLTVDGEMSFYGDNTSNRSAGILRYSSSSDDRNYAYRSAVQKVEIGNGVTAINSEGFYSCDALSSITIPKGVTSIGSYAFKGCKALSSINYPDGVTYLDSSVFTDCYALSSITIPEGVTSIGSYDFNGCKALSSISLPNSVTRINSSAFSYCEALSSVSIPDGITNIGNYAFSNCYNLLSISIPEKLTSVDYAAFSYCRAFASVSIPKGVTNLAYSSFDNCCGIQYYDFTKHTAVPTLANTSAFNKIPADCEIRVPSALYDEWIAATNWSTYASQIVAV